MTSFTFNRILLLFAGFIVYGSLYPFDFTQAPQETTSLTALYSFDTERLRWGDILSNVFLFIPFGFLSMAVATTAHNGFRRFALLTLSGIGLAVALQFAQLYIPTRYPSVLDALCNVCGIFLGGWLFLPLRTAVGVNAPTLSRLEFIACSLIAAWFLDYLWPLFPALDLQTLKDGLKPLIRSAPTSPYKIAITAITWMCILHLWEFVQKKPPEAILQGGAISTMFGLEIIMEGNALDWEEMLGAILAFTAWNAGVCRFRGRKELLILLMMGILTWKGLAPFVWRETPAVFYWMPFGISIMGEPMYQISVIIQKIFLYGCLAWLLIERKSSLPRAIGLGVIVLAGIEWAQRSLAEHTPEITDPLLFCFLILVIHNAFERQQASRGQSMRELAGGPMTSSHTIPS